MNLKVGDNAPDFNLLDEDENNRSLFNYKGKWVLLYFYPKDNTVGCIKEACMIRDDFAGFKKLDVIVLGVSTDSVKSHKAFVEKYNLPFTLLADDNKKVVKLYGVWGKKKFMGREYDGTFRTSFLINPNGKIEKIYQNVKPAKHSKEVLLDLENIKH